MAFGTCESSTKSWHERPLDLALHGWGREFEERADARERKLKRDKEPKREKKDRQKSAQSHVSTIKEGGRRVNAAVGYDGDGDQGEEEEAMGGNAPGY
jgi:hypothetical protein